MTDDALLRRSLRGDADAFRALYDRHAASVFGYALRITGEHDAAEDVTQNVFLALLLRGRTYDPSRPFQTWLLTLARNAAIDQLRRSRRHAEFSVDREAIEASAAPVRDAAAPDLVEHALARLPAVYRESVWLSDGLGLSYREVAQIMNCDLGTVSSRIARGRTLLRDHFVRNGHEL